MQSPSVGDREVWPQTVMEELTSIREMIGLPPSSLAEVLNIPQGCNESRADEFQW